jgi:T-complex protein 1 subunit alpha
VELADLQDREVGDGTTSVVILAGELLKRANDLVRNKIHPTSIISGYRLAMRESVKYIEDKLSTVRRALYKLNGNRNLKARSHKATTSYISPVQLEDG